MTMAYVHAYPPHGNVVEKADEYVVELAEFTEDEIAVSVDEDVVTIHIPRHRFAVNPDATPC